MQGILVTAAGAPKGSGQHLRKVRCSTHPHSLPTGTYLPFFYPPGKFRVPGRMTNCAQVEGSAEKSHVTLFLNHQPQKEWTAGPSESPLGKLALFHHPNVCGRSLVPNGSSQGGSGVENYPHKNAQSLSLKRPDFRIRQTCTQNLALLSLIL